MKITQIGERGIVQQGQLSTNTQRLIISALCLDLLLDAALVALLIVLVVS